MNGKIYLVATPIGNLEDITFRAIKILNEVDFILAEDTRHSIKLLNYFNIQKKLISYHRHNEEFKTQNIIEDLLNGKNIALISDAGTPAISDPGELIVKEAIKNNIDVISIPGACAMINALISSGINTNVFSFFGFIPINKKNRKEIINKIKIENKTVIIYEAPHKIKKTLNDLLNELGDINCVIAKELTKIHETFYRGKISELIEILKEPKGEFIIILDLFDTLKIDEKNIIESKSIEEQYEYYIEYGLEKKEVIKMIARNLKVNKNEIYQQLLDK